MSATITQATSTPSKPSNAPSLEAKANDLDGKAEFWTRWSFIFVSVTALSAVAYGVCQGYLVKRQGQAAQAHAAVAAEKDRESAAALALARAEAATESKRIEGEAGKQIAKVESGASQKIAEANLKISLAKKESAEAHQKASEANVRVALAEQHAADANAKAEGFRLSIAQANERSAKAQESLALAEQHSAEANAKAEGFRLDIASANERAAEANRIAEQERLARLQLEARLADRVISPLQEQLIENAFAPLKGKTVDVFVFGDTPEISQFSDKIITAMNRAGILLNVTRPLGGGGVRGVLIGLKSDAPIEFKTPADELVAILQQTVGGGAALWNFDQLVSNAAAVFGNTTGAAPVGHSPLRVWIGSK